MKNRKSIMAFSALLILCYHLWANVNHSTAEKLILQTSFVGVDMFFLLSGYSLAKRDAGPYFKFAWSRFKAVYLKFIIFSLVALVYSGVILGAKRAWNVPRFFRVISCVELFQKGGGSFLWFLPAIMLFYLLFPVFQRCDKKNRWVTLAAVLILWCAVSWFVTYRTNYKRMFIFWNRLPVFLLGFYIQKADRWCIQHIDKKKIPLIKLLAGVALVAIGYCIVYKWGFTVRLKTPFVDMFYLTGIPLSVGFVLLTSFIPEVAPIKWFGSSTLETYAIQMIFGYNIAMGIMAKIVFLGDGRAVKPLVVLANLLTIITVIVVSVAVHYLYQMLEKALGRLFAKKNRI